MEVSDLKNPPFCVFTYRDGHVVIEEDAESEVAARARFASAVDLCTSRDDAHEHRVELRSGTEVLDTWSSAAR